MIKRTVKNLSRAALVGILTGALLLLAVSQLPRAFGQRRVHGDNESLPRDATKASQSQLLRYDVRPNPPASPRPRGFYNVKDLLRRAAPTGASKTQHETGNMPVWRTDKMSMFPVQPLEPSGTCPPTITQSTSQVIADQGVACSDPGIGTLENHYWRAFNMNEFTAGQAYNITSVEFGILQALSLFGTDQPLTVNLYTNHGEPFPGGDWQSNLLATSGEIRVPNQEFTLFNVPLTTTVPAGTLELVMEVLSPDQTAEHNFFIIGSNPEPETGPSYLSAPDCGNPEPVPTRCIGFPEMRYVFNVNGSCVGPTPTPAPSPTPSPTPIMITGTIDNSDPTQNDRLNRGVISGCCGTAYPCQIFGDGQPHHYDAYTLTNTTGSTQCVTVGVNTDCQGSNFIFTAGYLGTFDPNNICANWIADEGRSPVPGDPTPFSFNIEDGQTFVLVVSEVTAGAGCPSYTMTVSGLGDGGTPTPTPTATPTATATTTPTATPRPTPTPRSSPPARPRPTPLPRP
jgi:hypothetical protein